MALAAGATGVADEPAHASAGATLPPPPPLPSRASRPSKTIFRGAAAPPDLWQYVRGNHSSHARGGVGYLRIARTGSATFVAAFADAEPAWRALGWTGYRDYHEFAAAPPAGLRRLVVTLREPVARVVSEYAFCAAHRRCVAGARRGAVS